MKEVMLENKNNVVFVESSIISTNDVQSILVNATSSLNDFQVIWTSYIEMEDFIPFESESTNDNFPEKIKTIIG